MRDCRRAAGLSPPTCGLMIIRQIPHSLLSSGSGLLLSVRGHIVRRQPTEVKKTPIRAPPRDRASLTTGAGHTLNPDRTGPHEHQPPCVDHPARLRGQRHAEPTISNQARKVVASAIGGPMRGLTCGGLSNDEQIGSPGLLASIETNSRSTCGDPLPNSAPSPTIPNRAPCRIANLPRAGCYVAVCLTDGTRQRCVTRIKPSQ